LNLRSVHALTTTDFTFESNVLRRIKIGQRRPFTILVASQPSVLGVDKRVDTFAPLTGFWGFEKLSVT
jgi:hypothetical protein